MKKKIAALIALLAIAVTGCQKTITAKTVDFSSLDSNTLTPTTITGELGEFELDSPFNNAVVDDVPSQRASRSAVADLQRSASYGRVL